MFQWPAFAHALTEVDTDQLDSADHTLAMLHRRASELGDWDSLPLVASAHSNVAYLLGRWQEARDLARQGERGSRQNGQRTGLAWSLAMRALVEVRRGNDSVVDALLDEARETATAIRAGLYVADQDVIAGMRWLELGDAVAAESALRRAGQRMLEEGYVGMFRRNVLSEWAEALIAAGRLTEATTLIGDHEDDPPPGHFRPRSRRRSERKRLLPPRPATRPAQKQGFLEALVIQIGCLRRSHAVGRCSPTARRSAVPGSAVAPGPPYWRPQRSSLRSLLPRWLARAQAELERTGHRAPGARLSPTEQQIADLVVAGRTNREVPRRCS